MVAQSAIGVRSTHGAGNRSRPAGSRPSDPGAADCGPAVTDEAFGATGRLEGWGLNLSSTVAGVAGSNKPDPAPIGFVGNTPNPFNPTTSIAFELGSAGHVRLEVFDLRGRRVRSLVSGEMAAGRHEVVWRGCDDNGRPVSSGIYFSRLTAGGSERIRKMTLVR